MVSNTDWRIITKVEMINKGYPATLSRDAIAALTWASSEVKAIRMVKFSSFKHIPLSEIRQNAVQYKEHREIWERLQLSKNVSVLIKTVAMEMLYITLPTSYTKSKDAHRKKLFQAYLHAIKNLNPPHEQRLRLCLRFLAFSRANGLLDQFKAELNLINSALTDSFLALKEERGNFPCFLIKNLIQELNAAQITIANEILLGGLHAVTKVTNYEDAWELGRACVQASTKGEINHNAKLLSDAMYIKYVDLEVSATYSLPEKAREFFRELDKGLYTKWALLVENQHTLYYYSSSYSLSAAEREKYGNDSFACYAEALADLVMNSRAKDYLYDKARSLPFIITDLGVTTLRNENGLIISSFQSEMLTRLLRVDIEQCTHLRFGVSVAMQTQESLPFEKSKDWLIQKGLSERLTNRIINSFLLYSKGEYDTAASILGPTSEAVVKFIVKEKNIPHTVQKSNPLESRSKLLDGLIDSMESNSNEEQKEILRWAKFILSNDERQADNNQTYTFGLNLRNRVCHDLDENDFNKTAVEILFWVILRLVTLLD